MITKFFKNIGKGILNILVIPVWAVGLAIMSVFGILIFVFIAIKKVILFISGRSVSNELPEDIQARKIIQAPTVEEPKVEIVHAVIEDPVVEEPKKVEPIKQAIEDQKIDDEHFWNNSQNGQKVSSWRGYAFENFCFLHINEIKTALGISGVNSSVSNFLKKGNQSEAGAQIDMVIERADNVVNLCEMKFYSDEFTCSKEEEASIRRKNEALSGYVKKKSTIRDVLITTFGLVSGPYTSIWSNIITLEDFFK